MEACKARSTQAICEGIDRRLEAKTSTKQTEPESARERLRDLSPPPHCSSFLLSFHFFFFFFVLSLFVLLCSSPFNLGCCWSSRLFRISLPVFPTNFNMSSTETKIQTEISYPVSSVFFPEVFCWQPIYILNAKHFSRATLSVSSPIQTTLFALVHKENILKKR